jgi:serine/threonine protein kinase
LPTSSLRKPESGSAPNKLLEQIGEGGFGRVWVAEQERPIRRRVALKIIKLGMDTHDVVARFEQERQALALMDHPNIAKVFDAGSTPTGRPCFVMELVRVIKITDFCDEAQLSTAERLKLFIQVCQAVQHAHQKGVIHRDLKPPNVLVTLHDGDGVINLLERAFAGNPTVSNLTILPAIDPAPPLLTITYTRAKGLTDLTLTVQESSDPALTSWTTASGTEVVTDLGAFERVQFTVDPGAAGRKFLRVRATQAP